MLTLPCYINYTFNITKQLPELHAALRSYNILEITATVFPVASTNSEIQIPTYIDARNRNFVLFTSSIRMFFASGRLVTSKSTNACHPLGIYLVSSIFSWSGQSKKHQHEFITRACFASESMLSPK